MKKKLSFILALTMLASAAFAGCNFTTIEKTSSDTDGDETSVYEIDADDNTAEETEIISVQEEVTNANGETVTDASGNVETTVNYYSIPVTSAKSSTGGSEAGGTTAASGTTKPVGVSEVTTNASQASQVKTVVPGQTEYDTLRSGKFYMVCNMTSDGETLPVEVAITSSTIYMTSDFEGATVGMLIDADKKVYMILESKKCYLELSDAVMNYMGMSSDDLADTSSMDFSKYPTLDKANAVNDVTLNGTLCKEYVFTESDGEMRVYLNGSKMLRYAMYDTSGNIESYADITSITGNVPSNKTTPPSDYKKYSGIGGLIGFFSQMSEYM